MNPTTCVEEGEVNCASAGRLLASIHNFKAENVPYKEVWNFYANSICLKENDSIGNIVQSYEDWTTKVAEDRNILTDLRKQIIAKPACHLEFCKALEFTGNADFAGIGVLVSLCVQISIATLFALLYLSISSGISKADLGRFCDSFNTFFISTIFFNIAIGLAATATIIMEDGSQYTAIFASLGLLLSLASTQTLWALHRRLISPPTHLQPPNPAGTNTTLLKKNKAWTETRLLKLCLVILWIDLLVMCGFITKPKWDSNFELFCLDRVRGRTFATKLLLTPIALVSFGLICAVLKKTFPGKTAGRSKRWDLLGPAATFLGIVVMWLSFGTMWYLRKNLGTVAGKGYQDNHWGFGQFAAVAALLPTLVEFIRASYRSLTGRQRGQNRGENRRKPRSESGSDNRSGDSGEESREGQNQGAGEGHEQGHEQDQEQGQGEGRTGDGGASQEQARAADSLV